MDKKMYALLLFVSYILITSISCAQQNNQITEKEYEFILLQEKFHNIRYDIQDEDDSIEKVLNEDEGEKVSKNLYVLTNDSVYVALNVSDQYTGFVLYSIQQIDDLSFLLKYKYNTERDSLLLRLNERNNRLEINGNKYYINKSYVDYLKIEGFDKKSIIPFIDFINPRVDDFFSFHDLIVYHWKKNQDNQTNKILKSEIQYKNPQNKDIIYDFSVEYIYKGDDLVEMIEYDQDRDTLYHKKYVNSTDHYELYEYNYSDPISRFYEEGKIYIDKSSMNDSIYSATTSLQRGQIDESGSKIILHKEYPIKKLNLSKTEIEKLISKDLILS